MKLSKFRRLVSLMCVVFMICVIVAPVAANYDDQISPHFISCPDCGGDMDRVWMRQNYNPGLPFPGYSRAAHYYAWGDGYMWQCSRCPNLMPATAQTGHYCTKNGGHYCLGGCSRK